MGMEKKTMTRSIGSFHLAVADMGSLRLDGGSMFGVVPRVMWERSEPPDEKNRIPLACNALLVSDERHHILVETGIGDRWDAKKRSIFDVKSNPPDKALAPMGITPEDITHVVNTHLHFDHAGGNLISAYDQLIPAFPNATYVISHTQWEHAVNPSIKDRASYRKEDFFSLATQGKITFVEGMEEIVPNVILREVGGHTPGMVIVEIREEDDVAIFLADLVPTRHHVSLPWIMAYDTDPLGVVETKQRILHQMAEERALAILYHDPLHPMGWIEENGPGNFLFTPLD